MHYSFFIGNSYLGDSLPLPVKGKPLDSWETLAFGCKYCGKVYAHAILNGMPKDKLRVRFLSCMCEGCRGKPPAYLETMFEVPGSIWKSWDQDYQSVLPESVLAYEVERHFNHLTYLESKGQQ